MRRRLLAIPSVADLSDFSQLVSQIAHYFGHLKLERVVILVDRERINRAREWLHAPSLPSSYRSDILPRIAAVHDAIDLRSWPCDVDSIATSSDVLLDWNVSRTHKKPWVTVRSERRFNRSLFEVDWKGRRLGAAWMAEVSKVLGPGRRFGKSGVEKLVDLARELGGPDICYLVGTGPSARGALEFDLTDGVRVVCNTVVLDDELMNHVRPHVVTFADPIFHFGPSEYAARFQEALADQAGKHDFLIVTTERYAPLLSAHIPSLAERVIGLRQGTKSIPDNFDLIRQPIVRPYPNVLTMLMFPLAASLAHTAGLIGFDGRQPDDEAFWQHGTTVQLGKELEHIRDVHPGFFDLDYVDYYREHLSSVERMIARLESRNFKVRSMTPSHMPPLRRRGGQSNQRLQEDQSVESATLVSVTPDWIDDFGHFGPFERRVHEAADQLGIGHVALASAGLQPRVSWQKSTFTDSTAPAARFAPISGWKRFEKELRKALDDVEVKDDAAIAMYTADVWHLPGIISVGIDNPGKRFVVNLMKAHTWIDEALTSPDGWLASLVNFLDLCLATASHTNVEVTVDSASLAKDVELLTGHSLRVWPMIVVSALTPDPMKDGKKGAPLHIVAPVQAQEAKGFANLAALSNRLRKRFERDEVRLTVRHVSEASSSSDATSAMADAIRSNGAVVLEENLTDEEFRELIESSDIVLLPYQVRPFRTRTSGVVLDALLAGKPVVTVRGTWAAEVVESYGAGATYDQGQVDQMEQALDQVASNLDSYRERLASVSLSVRDEYAPTRLVQFLRDFPEIKADKTPTIERVQLLHLEAERLRDLHMWHTKASTDLLIDAAVRDDARQRNADEKADEIEKLRRAIRWRDSSPIKPTPLSMPSGASLDRQVFPREAHAQLDEVALIVRLFEADGKGSGWMIDVGAHHGSALRHLLAKSWLIHAFEPDEVNAEHLAHRFGDDERVSIDRRACLDTSGQRYELYRSAESTGVSSLTPFLDSHESVGYVDTVALRDIIGDRHCDFLKIDAEGYDLKVLEGYPWDSDRPDVVVCEFEDRKTRHLGYSVEDIATFLAERGYQVWMSEWHPVIEYGKRHDWHKLQHYPWEASDPDSWGNLIAFLKPRSESEIAAVLAELIEVADDFTLRPNAYVLSSETDTESVPPSANASVARDQRQDSSETQPDTSRREAVLSTLQGSFGKILVITLVLVGISLAVAAMGWVIPALVLASAAVLGSALSSLVVAVRLERRSTPRLSASLPDSNDRGEDV